MISQSVFSKFVLVDSIVPSDSVFQQVGQNTKWLGPDLIGTVKTINNQSVPNPEDSFLDGTYFDGLQNKFIELTTESAQNITIYQVLTTKRTWVDSTQDIIQLTPVNNIILEKSVQPNLIYAGNIENIFITDSANPEETIKIFNNTNLSHGWTVETSQELPIDPASISRAWIYDSVTKIKLVDLEVVDLSSGILPGTLDENLDYICDNDPAIYNIPNWMPGALYNISDRVLYGGLLYQALHAGKSGSVFNSKLWTLIESKNTFTSPGNEKWGNAQLGKTWFKTQNLKTVNAQLGTISQRASDWNQWFPNSQIEVYEWVSSAVPPAAYSSSDANGYITDPNCPYTFDAASNAPYGFWVYDKTLPGTRHDMSTDQLISALANIPNSGIPMLTAIDTNAVAVWNINQFISANTVILHIDYVLESADNQPHNEFALISNDGTKSWYHTPIYQKFIDSLTGVTSFDLLVPDITLPSSQQTGILENPVQSIFVNRVTALDIYYSVINSQLANLAVTSSAIISALSASDPLPISGFSQQLSNRTILNQLDITLFPENYRILLTEDSTLNNYWSIVAVSNGEWQIVQTQLYDLSKNWKYIDWYSPDYISTQPTYSLNSIGDLPQITYKLNDVVQINGENGNSSIYLATANSLDSNILELEPILIHNGSIQFLPNLYDFISSGIGFDVSSFDAEPFDNDPYLEIRMITSILNDMILVGNDDLTKAADRAFYAVIQYIMSENKNLDWLFKTSFVSVNYTNRSLNIQGNYEPDNQSTIENFIQETTPFHTRIRQFNDTYTSDDYANIGISDFDLPAQYDNNYANIVLEYTNNVRPNGLLQLSQFSNITGVFADATSFYVTSNGLPNYATNFPQVDDETAVEPQNWSFGFPQSIQTANTTFTTIINVNGPEALATNGIPFYSSNSGENETLYQLGNIANQQTLTINSVWEAIQDGLDPGAGYPNENGVFQYFSDPYLLYTKNSSSHSPIIGYAWDGSPIYGPYGFANANGTGGIIKNTSSYELSLIPRLDASGQPIVNGLQLAIYSAPSGKYIQDFNYVANLGTLDENNGRQCVTPEYPNGIYAYFITVDNNNVPTYPYVLGPNYNGIPFNTAYTYINGNNIPVYSNGNITIPFLPVIDTVNGFIRTPDGSVSSDPVTLQLPVYSAWNNNYINNSSLIRSIDTTLRFDRVSSSIEYLDANVSYPVSSVLYDTANSAFVEGAIFSVANVELVNSGQHYKVFDLLNLEGGTYSNSATILVTSIDSSHNNSISTFSLVPAEDEYYTSFPSNIANVLTTDITVNSIGYGATFSVNFQRNIANNNSIAESTAMNRITALYEPTNNMFANQARLLMNNVEYPGVFVNGGDMVQTYSIPTGSLYDIDDDSEFTSLNVAWHPNLITNTGLSMVNARFGNSSGYFGGASSQYITANQASPDINDLGNTSNIFTIEFFCNFSNINSNIMTLIDTRLNNSSNNGMVIYKNSANYICFGENTSNAFISSLLPVTINDWTYITVQGNGNNLYIYFNGMLNESVANIGLPIFSDSSLTIGAEISGANIFSGYLDELRWTTGITRYTPGTIIIPIPNQPFPRNLAGDPYFNLPYTPIIYGFESLNNEASPTITFEAVNSVTYINDLSWNQKQLELVNYGSNLKIDSSLLNTNIQPQNSLIMALTLNQ